MPTGAAKTGDFTGVKGTHNERATSPAPTIPVVLAFCRYVRFQPLQTRCFARRRRVPDAPLSPPKQAHGYVSQSPARHASLAQVVMRGCTLTSCRRATIPRLLRTVGDACSRNERFSSSCADVEPLRPVSRSQSQRRRLTCVRGWVCALRR